MNDQTDDDQADEDTLSDEALEAAADTERGTSWLTVSCLACHRLAARVGERRINSL